MSESSFFFESEEVTDPEDLALRTMFAEQFVLSGVSLTEWQSLSSLDKVALVAARQKVRTELILQLATALEGPFGASFVAGGLDEGESHQRLLLAKGMERAERRVRGKG